MSWSLVQKAIAGDATGSGFSTFSASASANFTTGNTIVGFVAMYANGHGPITNTSLSISDGTNSYPQVDFLYSTTNGNDCAIVPFFLANITGGQKTITVTFSAAFAYPLLSFIELSGGGTGAALNVHSVGETTAATGSPYTAASSTVTPKIGDLLYGYAYVELGGTLSSVVSNNGFTPGNTDTTNTSIGDQYQVATSTSSTAASFTYDQTPSTDTNQDLIGIFSITPSLVGGSLSSTFADFTLSGTGKVVAAGSLSSTFSDFTLSGTGKVVAAGSLSSIFADFTLAGTAQIPPAGGLLLLTFADFTLSGTATVPVAGSLSSTFADFTLAGTGTISADVAAGALSTTFADFILAGTGAVPTAGSLSLTFADFALSGTGRVVAAAVGSLSVTFSNFTLVGAGAVLAALPVTLFIDWAASVFALEQVRRSNLLSGMAPKLAQAYYLSGLYNLQTEFLLAVAKNLWAPNPTQALNPIYGVVTIAGGGAVSEEKIIQPAPFGLSIGGQDELSIGGQNVLSVGEGSTTEIISTGGGSGDDVLSVGGEEVLSIGGEEVLSIGGLTYILPPVVYVGDYNPDRVATWIAYTSLNLGRLPVPPLSEWREFGYAYTGINQQPGPTWFGNGW